MTNKVIINTAHIGDDNDYSCFLSQILQIVYKENPVLAYDLYKTDPLGTGASFAQFDIFMKQYILKDQEI